MAKPILRLGPVDELDDELEHLLGRSVRDEPDPTATSATAPLDPDQSIFDEPEPVADEALAEATIPVPAKPVAKDDQPSLLDWMEKPNADEKPELASVLPQESEHAGVHVDAEPILAAEDDNPFGRDVPAVPEPIETLLTAPPSEPESEPEPVVMIAEHVVEETVLEPPLDQVIETAQNTEEPSIDVPESAFALHEQDGQPLALADAPLADETTHQTEPAALDGAAQITEPVEAPKGPSRAAQRRANMKRSPIGRRKATQKLAATVAGTALFAIALFFTLLSFMAPLGYPFDAVSSYRWYWTLLALLAGLSWAVVRGRNMMIASALVGAINLLVIFPSLGASPKGGQISNAVVAWANVADDEKALEKVLREAERQKAGLVLIAKAPRRILTPPAGWNVLERPNFDDPTSIAVLSRGRWQSSTIPGEPTIARTAAGDLTIIATLPPASNGTKGVGAARESQLNRAAVRAGDQDGPVAVLGDFGVAPWDGAMSQFRKYGNVTRVQCGGFMGTTVSKAFGLIGITHDHAFVRDVKVTHCRLGGSLNSGGHRAIYLYLAPLDTAK